MPGAKVGLLIGSNCPKALEPMDVVASENGGPFAVKTFAGWAIVGPLNMCNKEHSTVNCNRIATKEIGSKRLFDHHFMIEDRVKEIVTPQALNEMFELDFSERSIGKELEHSQEDRKFLQMVKKVLHAQTTVITRSLFHFASVMYVSLATESKCSAGHTG